MPRFIALLEGILLACLGLFMLWLSLSGQSWHLLHPRFASINAVSGAFCLVLGVFFAFRSLPATHGALDFSRIACFVLFFVLASFSLRGVQGLLGVESPASSGGAEFDAGPPPQGSLTLESVVQENGREVLDGVEYVRMNVAEMHIGIGGDERTVPRNIAWQGMVIRTPELDSLGMIGVFRVAIVCCLADAVAPGFAVVVPHPEQFTSGQWLRITGALERVEKPLPGEPYVPGVIATIFERNERFLATDVRIQPRPEIPFIFEFREKEPFAY